MRMKWVLWLILLGGLGRGALAFLEEPDTPLLLKTADEMIKTATRLRGLEPKGEISKGVKSREEISQYLNEKVQEDYSTGELEQEGRMFRRLGLLPAAIDYKDFTLKLLTEQVGGFYDPDKKSFFIASWLSAEEQKPVMVHELTHALQDQNFDVGRILREDRKQHNDDRTLAHEAVLEGDGMVVMLNFLLEPAHRGFADLPDLASVMHLQMSTMQSQFAVFKDAPVYLQETLLFPYGYGSSFIQQVWKRNPSWQSVNRIYSDMPASTEQIMHPDKYLSARDDPKPVPEQDPAARLGKGWQVAYRNVLGEFSMGLLLGLHMSEERARRCATGWGGDEALLLENGEGRDAVFVNSVWDTDEDAGKFFTAMQDWLQQAYPKARKTSGESPDRLTLVSNGELHSVVREGSSVRFVIGLPEAEGAASKLP